ncbi:MAG: indole-3-glycerol phosphate synthase TrpC [Deltaproteobacteria bacterium]|nr:indole-3-glycerol phosphate synthase TrpC [Deltaproteobacteria bacterium]
MDKNFLKKIIERKKIEIAEHKKTDSEQSVREIAEKSAGNKIFFYNALKKTGDSGISIIAEIKRASPSKGEIKIDLNAAKLAEAYRIGGAAAISVLTDSYFFKGSFNDFKIAKKSGLLPVLRKDFIISSYQIFQSAALLKADAILLIAKILSKEQLKDYVSLAGQLGMSALVEVDSEKSINEAHFANAEIIGINNRNLNTFKTDITNAARLASMIDKKIISIAASGIKNKKDIEESRKAGLYNFLIGESLVRADNTVSFLKKLRGET